MLDVVATICTVGYEVDYASLDSFLGQATTVLKRHSYPPLAIASVASTLSLYIFNPVLDVWCILERVAFYELYLKASLIVSDSS
jgi:hypothetical protein